MSPKYCSNDICYDVVNLQDTYSMGSSHTEAEYMDVL